MGQEPKKKMKIKILALSGSGFTRGPTVLSLFVFLKLSFKPIWTFSDQLQVITTHLFCFLVKKLKEEICI